MWLRTMMLVIAIAGCSASDRPPGACSDGTCGGVGGTAGEGGVSGTGGSGGACAEGATQQCICTNNSVGSRACVGGAFGDCSQCQDASVPPASPCTPGRYVGEFAMAEYYPNAAGLCGITTLFGGMQITGTFAFTLADRSDPSDEFARIVGPESCLELELPSTGGDGGIPVALDGGSDGGASVQFDAISMAFVGNVNCTTGELTGELRGAYYTESVCNLGTVKDWYSVKGSLSGTFNPTTRSFETGVIDIQEPPGLFDSLGLAPRNGGVGTWTADLDPDAPVPEPVADCLDGAPWTDFELTPR